MMRYPDITITICLDGLEGNAMAIMGLVARELKRVSVPQDEIDDFYKEAKSGDYEHLCSVCEDWVNMEWE